MSRDRSRPNSFRFFCWLFVFLSWCPRDGLRGEITLRLVVRQGDNLHSPWPKLRVMCLRVFGREFIQYGQTLVFGCSRNVLRPVALERRSPSPPTTPGRRSSRTIRFMLSFTVGSLNTCAAAARSSRAAKAWTGQVNECPVNCADAATNGTAMEGGWTT